MKEQKAFIKRVKNKKIIKNTEQQIIMNNNKIIKKYIIKFSNIYKLLIITIRQIQNILNFYKDYIRKNNLNQ